MDLTPRQAWRMAAAAGFLAVACGAFGAHGLKEFLALRPGAAQWWEKAVFYHLTHAVIMCVLPLARPFPRTAFILFGLGIVLFSGSLYLLALTGAFWLVFVTPIGGISLLGGWLAMFLSARKLQLD